MTVICLFLILLFLVDFIMCKISFKILWTKSKWHGIMLSVLEDMMRT